MKNRTLMLRTILFAIAAVGFVACGDGGTDPEPDPVYPVYPDPCFPNGCGPADFDPAWSPNGSEIAVSSSYPDGDNKFDIHVIDTLGNAVRLTSGLIAARSPTWSPDGSRIAFSGWPGFGERRLYVVNRDGSGLTELLALPGLSWPAWSPDGETIAFSTDGLHLFDMATSVVTGLGVVGGGCHGRPMVRKRCSYRTACSVAWRPTDRASWHCLPVWHCFPVMAPATRPGPPVQRSRSQFLNPAPLT